jgi:hypothetical protein
MNEIFELNQLDVINSPASFFSKEDVLKIINTIHFKINQLPKYQNLEEPNAIQAALPSDKFAEFTSKVREKLYYYLDSNEIVDLNSAEFEISYDNRIELTRVHVDLDSWTEEFDMYMLDTFTDVFGDDSIIEQ